MTVERLTGGNNDGALFIGIEEGERVFWDYRTDQLLKEEQAQPYDLNGEFVGSYIAKSIEMSLWNRSSTLGAFLATVAKYQAAPGMLGERQATVYALREIGDVSRQHTARALGASPSTVDSALATATQKITAFEAVSEALQSDRAVENNN